MKKKYKIQLPKGKKVTMTNVNFENGVMTVNVELENRKESISEAEKVIKHLRSIDWDKRTKESVDRIRDELYHKKHPETISNYERWESKFGDRNEQKYEPKDGDFVKIEQDGKLYFTPDLGIGYSEKEPSIGIFKSIEMDGGKELLLCYITLMRDSRYEILLPLENEGRTFSVGEVSNLKVSPATEEENKLLIDKLAEKGKKWNPETKRIEDVRWRANDGDHYYYLLFGDTDLLVTETTDIRTYKDDERYNRGNYFKTRKAAEKTAEQIREIFQNSKAE